MSSCCQFNLFLATEGVLFLQAEVNGEIDLDLIDHGVVFDDDICATT